MFNQQSIFNCCFTHRSGGVKSLGRNPRCKMRSAPNGDPATNNRGGGISIWRSKPGSLGGRWMFFFSGWYMECFSVRYIDGEVAKAMTLIRSYLGGVGIV